MRYLISFLFILLMNLVLQAQKLNKQNLDSILISSSRIDLPFSENSRTISIITAEDIKASPATNLADLLQQISGVDIRRRGTEGTQADLYIRGGSFEQTLLLIDGIKLDDSQTGHHSLNMALPLEVIERVEIIKGPASRIFGQNAFTGAINIVTKKHIENFVELKAKTGSFNQKHGVITIGSQLKNSSHLFNYTRNTSDGYRTNSDYDNQTLFLKSSFNTQNTPIHLIANFAERNFGAENFYTTNPAFNEYEETQTSLLGIYTTLKDGSFTYKPRIYWRRNQDIFLLKRHDPDFYRNLHITNKVGIELNTSYTSSLGVTGFGLDIAQIYISSNNLGQRNRLATTLFLEHRFKLLNNSLDITPGISANYFSDFKFHAFPGVDIGYKLNTNLRLYGNVGYTYRVPTYTDLYYSDPATVGNADLKPEKAFAQELGVHYSHSQFNGVVALFNRDSDNLIDYVSNTAGSPLKATNIQEVNTQGFEVSADYTFSFLTFNQSIASGYTFLEDNLKDTNANFSRYSLNSLKHHFTTTLTTQFFKNLSQSIVYKYAERTQGNSYNVVDASVTLTLNAFEFRFTANNIFNAEYIESGFVPMPKGNVLFNLSYRF